jgi:HTH-type transcriptional regulator/antitoxin HigA
MVIIWEQVTKIRIVFIVVTIMTRISPPFTPDWVSPPGDTILDLLEERGWKQAELAARTGYTTKHIGLLINGKASITDETAIRLERVIGSTARFWLAREGQYREAWRGSRKWNR